MANILEQYLDYSARNASPAYAQKRKRDEELEQAKQSGAAMLEAMSALDKAKSFDEVSYKGHPYYETAQAPIPVAERPTDKHLSKYDAIINIASEHFGVDPALIRSVILAESGGNAKAVSKAGAGGVMQLMPATAKRFGVTDRFNPQQNIQGGTNYLKFLLDRYGGNEQKAVAAYNAGEGNIDKGIMPAETRAYVPKVMDYLAQQRQGQQQPQAQPQQPMIADSGQIATDAPQSGLSNGVPNGGLSPELEMSLRMNQAMLKSGDPVLMEQAIHNMGNWQSALLQRGQPTADMKEAQAAGLPIMDYLQRAGLARQGITNQQRNLQTLIHGSPQEQSGMLSILHQNPLVERAIAQQKESGQKEAESTAKALDAMPAAIAGHLDMGEHLDSMQQAVNSARQLMQTNPLLTTGVFGQMLGHVPGSDAKALQSRLEEIKSNLALQTMKELKASSPTGASGFGALSEKELAVITNLFGELERAQGADELSKKLEQLDKHINRAKLYGKQHYDADMGWAKTVGGQFPQIYGRIQSFERNMQPPQEDKTPAQTFTKNKLSLDQDASKAKRAAELRAKYGLH